VRDFTVREGAAVAFYVFGLGLIATGFFEPTAIVGLTFCVVIGLALGLGLVVGRWWLIVLSLVVVLSVGDALGTLETWGAALGSALVLIVGVHVHRYVSARWAVRVGAVVLAFAVLVFAWGGYRQLSPLDVTPAHPIVVNVGAGTAGSRWLGERVVVARRGLGALVDSDIAISGGSPGFLDDGSVTLWFDSHGHVTGIESRNSRYQTVDGVGVGDSMTHARSVYPGLLCAHDEFDEPECAGRQGSNLLFLVGNPVRSLEISSSLCYPALLEGDPTTNDCPQARRLLRP